MKPLRILLCSALTLALAACGMWNDYKHPESPTPATWSGANATSPWPTPEWWAEFHSPALTTLITEAQKASPDLQAAVARVREADAQLRIAGAPLLPAVNANAGETRQKQASKSGTVSFSNKPFNSATASLSASYELDFWGKNWSAAESARALADASRFDREVVALTITSGVANTYFSILAVEERLRVANENLANAKDLLGSFRARFDAGTANALDVAQQESVVAAQTAAVPPLELQLRQNMDALAILLGKLPEDVQSPDSRLDTIGIPAITPGLPSELLERRPDVQEAEANLISANANIINARAQFFPDITLTGSRGYASGALSSLFRPDSILYSLAASAVQPIFEGGKLTGQLEFSQAKYDELLANYRKAVLSAFSDVEDALSAVQQDAAQEAAQAEAVKTARRAYDMSLEQLRGGITDITTVLNTQRTLFSAQDALVQARLAHLQAIVNLYKALGGGWQGKAE